MVAINAVTDLTVEDGIAIITVDYPPVNALSHQVRSGIVAAMQQFDADPTAQAAVLICAGRTFIAGADITEFGKPPQAPTLYDVEDAVESASKPVIAAIHGTALGGGLEVALCCHYRIAVPSARCGLPEVNLGLIPGAGGTQRLPRIIGAQQALDIISSGKHVPAPKAHALGLVDELAPEGELRDSAIAFARKILAEGRPLKRVRDLQDKVEADRSNPGLFDEFRKTNARKFRGFDAPEAVIRSVQAAVELPFDEGLAVERKAFLSLMEGTQSKAQRYAFFAERQVWKIPDVPEDTPVRPIQSVGIIGAGTMGGGIAMNFANVGIPVTLVETNPEALERGLGVIRKNYESSAQRGRIKPEEAAQRMALLRGSLQLEDLAACDLVIEAVFENMEVKRDLFTRLDAILAPDAILASNTSALDLNELAAVTQRPEQVIGLHFFSPANVMRLLEVVRGEKTANTVIATAMALAKRIGKIGVLVRVCPGFVGNRMLYAQRPQAYAMLQEGALPWDIDRVMYGFGMPMGPFAMSDLAGLDLGWSKATSTSSTLREVLCEMDRRGQKTGAGFYDYDAQRKATPSPITEQVIKDFMAKRGATARAIGDEEILVRCLYPMINEGAKILEEGIAIRPSDIDMVWLNGYGFPRYRGGPMFYADTVGLDQVVAKLKQYSAQLGAEFSLSPLLEKLAAEGKRFQDLK